MADNQSKAPRKAGRHRKAEITIREIASLDPPEIRLLRAQFAGFEVSSNAIEGTTRERYRRIETPFDRARRMGWIAEHHHKSAEILMANFQRAGILPRVTMNWSAVVDGSGFGDGSEARDKHQRKFRAAISAIPDEYRDGFLTWFIEAQSSDVTIDGLGALFIPLKHKEARKGAGILALTAVLNSLSWHYGVSSETKRARRLKTS